MKKILTEAEIKKYLDKYCPGTTIEFFTDAIVTNNEEIGLYSSINGSKTSLKCVAYEYAFVKQAREKFERLEFPQYTYYLDYKPDIDFSLCGQEIECDVAITLARNEHKYFDLTLDSGLCICGVERSDYVDSSYRLTLSRVDRIDPYDSVEDIQEQARDLVDEMLDQLSKYELRK